MRHGVAARTAATMRVVLVGAITVLLGRVIEEAATAFKVGGVILRAAGGGIKA
jgi:hypothetical protein